MKKNLKNIETKTWIKLSTAFLVVTVMSYVYLVNAATFNTAKAQSLSEEVAVLQSEVSDLEFQYIEKTKNISMNDAAQFGLVQNERKAQKILVAKNNTKKLTLNTEIE